MICCSGVRSPEIRVLFSIRSLTETLLFRLGGARSFYVSRPRKKILDEIEGTELSFNERVPADQPLSVDGFRGRILGSKMWLFRQPKPFPMPGTFRGRPFSRRGAER